MMAYRLVSSLLTSVCGYGFLEVPNPKRRSNRLSCLPKTGRSIAAYSAVEVATFAGSLLSHISRVASSRTREGWRLLRSRGDLYPAFFVIPNPKRFPMIRFFLSSRWTRFQYRFLSLTSFFICRAAALALLAAVLLFGCAPELVGGAV